MNTPKRYYTSIIGGGLAGLALSIQLSRLGHSVILFEKEQYPFHKVCGEYISLESWDFLNNLGVDLDQMKVPIITKLAVSAVSGKTIEHPLPMGGFGISRYILDAKLAELARQSGATIMEKTKVNEIRFANEEFTIVTDAGNFNSSVSCGCWGKRSNLDIKWKRNFSTAATNKLNNYVAVKYHIDGDFPPEQIALHNFSHGYCGISRVENNRYNLCYLTTADNLQKSQGDIHLMEKSVLGENPYLQQIFSAGTRSEPLTISQISFDSKTQVENHMLMIGDAAGMIAPLCGNGMSMALHASKIAALHIHHFLSGQISREKMEKRYLFQWQKQFSGRLKTGRRIQRLFGKNWLTNLFIRGIKPFPALVDRLIQQTHGKPF